MREITLIRHGQANTGARSEADYDRLSDLGRRQARWLGEYLSDSGGYARVISGGLNRQRQTAEALNRDGRPLLIDPRLNELDYFGLSEFLTRKRGVPFPENAAEFAAHVVQVLDVWRNEPLAEGLERYDDFRARILGAARAAAGGADERVVLVTSTGVIATLIAIALGLDTVAKARLFLRVMNTSVHRFELVGDEIHLLQFGAVPHLDRPGRRASQTYF